MQQTSRGKFNRLQRATAEFTTSALDGYGLRGHLPARPTPYASYPVLVHRLAPLLHAAFRPRLATTPWRFAITSPPSGCQEDSHLQAVEQCSAHKQKGASRWRRPFLFPIPYFPFPIPYSLPLSPWWPGHMASAEQMQVEMIDGLAAIFAC